MVRPSTLVVKDRGGMLSMFADRQDFPHACLMIGLQDSYIPTVGSEGLYKCISRAKTEHV